MILEIGSKGFVGPSIFWPLKMGLKRRKVENHCSKPLTMVLSNIRPRCRHEHNKNDVKVFRFAMSFFKSFHENKNNVLYENFCYKFFWHEILMR